MDRATSIATSMFVIGADLTKPRRVSTSSKQAPKLNDMPFLSREVTVGRNSNFCNLTSRDREELGGVEYRALKLLLKIVIGKFLRHLRCRSLLMATGYFLGLHLFGAICLVGWVQYANPKYTSYLASVGQDKNWWYVGAACNALGVP